MLDGRPRGAASRRSIFAFAALLLAPAVWAGPPFVTDDPEPVAPGAWEVYTFSSGTRTAAGSSGTRLGFDVNYGAQQDLQLHALVSLAFDAPTGAPVQQGLGDAEVGAKWRLFDPGPDDWRPQVAIYPAISFATGDQRRGLGSGHTRAFLPVWLQEDFGDWTSFGGVGYGHQTGAGLRDYGFVGVVLQRRVSAQLALGAELFHLTPDAVGGSSTTGLNLGTTYDLDARFHLLLGIGRGLRDVAATDELQYYLAIQWTD